MIQFILIATGVILGGFLIFNKLTDFMCNDYNLICYFGKKGCGKTSFIACDSIKRYKEGWSRCYSTCDIKGCYTIDLDDIGNFKPLEHSVIYIDEIGLIMNNRDFKSFKKEWLYFFKMQRHYKCKVICFSQVYDDMDKVVRNMFDELWIITNFARVFSLQRRVKKKITISNFEDNNGNSNGGKIVDIYKYGGLPKLIFLPRYFSFFDSFEKVDKPLLEGSYNELDKECNLSINGFKYYFFGFLRSLKKILFIPIDLIKKIFSKKIKIKVSSTDDNLDPKI